MIPPFIRLLSAVALLCWTTLSGLSPGFAQSKEWQDNIDLVDPQLQRFNEAYHSQQYRTAATYHLELLRERPDSPYLLRCGTDIYQQLAQQTDDAYRKLELTNMMLALYEERIRVTGDTVALLNRKINTAFMVLYPLPTYYRELLRLSQKDMQRLGSQIAPYNLMPYASLVCQLYQSGELDRRTVVQTQQWVKDIVAIHPPQSSPESYDYQQAEEKVLSMMDACLSS